MPARLTGDKERTPIVINITYIQRDAMRKEIGRKTTPYNTYGKLVMAIIRGEANTLYIDPKDNSTAFVGLKIYLTKEEQSEILRLSHEEDVTPTAFIRNRVFGEEYRSRKTPHNTRPITIGLKEPEEMVIREALGQLGVTGSLPQGVKYLAMLMASQLLAASLENNGNTDLMDKAVETEQK